MLLWLERIDETGSVVVEGGSFGGAECAFPQAYATDVCVRSGTAVPCICGSDVKWRIAIGEARRILRHARCIERVFVAIKGGANLVAVPGLSDVVPCASRNRHDNVVDGVVAQGKLQSRSAGLNGEPTTTAPLADDSAIPKRQQAHP